jgi:hypothetical protein
MKVETSATVNETADVLVPVNFLDLYSTESCHVQVNSFTGLSFLGVTGIVDNGQQGTLNLNPPIDRKAFDEADEAGVSAMREEAKKWCDTISAKITALAARGNRRIPLENAGWLAKGVTNKHGRMCGDIVRRDRQGEMKPRWSLAAPVPPSVDNSELDLL